MDPATWLLISTIILASHYIALKLTDRIGSRRQYAEPIPEEPPEPIQVIEVGEPSEQPPEPPKPEKNEAEQETAEPAENQDQAPEPEPPSIRDLDQIAAKLSELKTLLKMSEELKKELGKLANKLNSPETAKRVN